MSGLPGIPEGWDVEPEDRSVGIFGDVFWHDNCPAFDPNGPFPEGYEGQEPKVHHIFVGWSGWEFNRCIEFVVLFICPDCHQVGIAGENDWYPTDEGIAEQMEMEKSWR